jgi:hypothetical protein
VEVLGWVDAPPDFDYDCGTSSADVELGRWLEVWSALVQQARAGADTLVTISHACQREWCDAGGEGLEVRNYISLVADALASSATTRSTSSAPTRGKRTPRR